MRSRIVHLLFAAAIIALSIARVYGVFYVVDPPKLLFCCDVDFNGQVDLRDVSIVASSFGSTEGMPHWNPSADLNLDGRVDIRDVAIVSRFFGMCF